MKEGWEVKRLDDLCIIGDGNHSGNYPKKSEFIESGVPFIRGLNLLNGKIDGKEIRYISRDKHLILKKGHLKEGDILFANRGEIGKKAIVQKEFNDSNLNSQLAWFRCGELILNQFLFYQLDSPFVYKQIEHNIRGAALQQLTIRNIKKIEVIVPPLPEQKQIVAILDKAFAAIDQAQANIERNIENTKELFDSKKEDYFNQLSVINDLIPLNDVCEKIFAGGDKPKDNFSKTPTEELNIPIIANAVKDNGLYGYTNKAKVTKPSITVAARGSGTGHTEYRDYPFVPIVRLIVLTPDTDKVEVEFLMYSIKNLTITRSGSAIPQLTVPMIKSYSIPVPSKERQTEIVENLNKLELELEDYKTTLEKKILELEDLKKSILQKAFSGELTKKELAV